MFMTMAWRVVPTTVSALVGVFTLTAVVIVALSKRRLYRARGVISVVSVVALWALVNRHSTWR